MDRRAGTSTDQTALPGLPPVLGDTPRILILGSFPGAASLRHAEYYGNPQNHFWKIIKALFSIDCHLPYPDRTARLCRHHIALWDVIGSCIREGSADEQIKDPVFNPVAAFLTAHPSVQLVALNGTAARRFYQQLCIPSPVPSVTLPSTSPANTRFTFAEKVREWEIILTCPEGE